MRSEDTVVIAIQLESGALSIMHFITRVVMPGPDDVDIIREVDPTLENIEAEIAKHNDPWIEWKIIDKSEIPVDRTYRNAWVLRNGTIEVDLPRATEIALSNIRLERNQKVIESDVYVLPDRWNTYTIEQQNAWTNYRQALRDFPETVEDVFNPVWPVSPE